MYNIIETTGVGAYARKLVHHTTDSFADAVALAHQVYAIVDFEYDALHQGCADFFTRNGVVLSIEPAGFTLAKGA